MNELTVAAAQISPELGDLQVNMEKHVELIRRAREKGVDVLLFPELSLTGYDIQECLAQIAITPDAELFRKLADAAGDMAVITGFVELGYGAQLHNSALVLVKGNPYFIHRKLNLPNYGSLEEGKHFGSGRFMDTFEVRKPWWASILICADAWNPGLVHICAVKGTSMLFVPVNSARGTVGDGQFSNPENWDICLRFYSRIYGMPIVMVNRCGREGKYSFWGKSKIYSPFGEVVSEAGEGEELISANIDFQDVVRARVILPTVRDSNLDLIHREVNRMRDSIGSPSFWIAETTDQNLLELPGPTGRPVMPAVESRTDGPDSE